MPKGKVVMSKAEKKCWEDGNYWIGGTCVTASNDMLTCFANGGIWVDGKCSYLRAQAAQKGIGCEGGEWIIRTSLPAAIRQARERNMELAMKKKPPQ